METDKRKTIHIKAQMSDIESLKVLRELMSEYIQRKFILKFGRILDLLIVPVKVKSITSLAPFYDSPLQCFLFQYFQLASALEEFRLYLKNWS